MAIRAVERTIAGQSPGTVIRCVLEIAYRDGSTRLEEVRLGEGGFATAAFEEWLRVLNRELGS